MNIIDSMINAFWLSIRKRDGLRWLKTVASPRYSATLS